MSVTVAPPTRPDLRRRVLERISWPRDAVNSLTVGEAMYRLASELYPLHRSITGDGLRETFRRIGALIPLVVTETPSGTPVFDWTVPLEWNIREAWIAGPTGERVVDLAASNLHVVQYSTPLRRRMPLAELRSHLHSLPEHPDWIPYRTSYDRPNWGFCLSHRVLESLPDGEYEVCIDSTLRAGSLTYVECVLPGTDSREILLSCHCCHPSLANDNLSGIALAVALARVMKSAPRRWTYRFLFTPGTIGAVTWLARNPDAVRRVAHGLVLACVGDRGTLTYKRSRRGNAFIDRAVEQVLRHSGAPFDLRDFEPFGYDERQYCSPGFDLPVGCLTRSTDGGYPEQHTSADDLSRISAAHLGEAFARLFQVVQILEDDRTYLSENPCCEPQLDARGLGRVNSDAEGGGIGGAEFGSAERALLWVLNQSDGARSLLDIAERSSLPFGIVRRAADELAGAGLLRERAVP